MVEICHAEAMEAVFATLAVFSLIALGGALRLRVWRDGAFWEPLERLNYHVLLPAFLFQSIASASQGGAQIGAEGMLAFAAVTLLVIAGFWWASKAMGLEAVAIGPWMLSGFRWNSYLGLALAIAWWGEEGRRACAELLMMAIPWVNLLSVILLACLAHRLPSPAIIMRELVRNPLIMGCLAGMLWWGLSLPSVPVVFEALGLMGKASLPLGLMNVGAAIAAVGGSVYRGALLRLLAFSSLGKLIASPLVMMVAGAAAGVQGIALKMLVLLAALPGAPAAYLQIKREGGDAGLMAATIGFQTLIALITLSVLGGIIGDE